MIVSPEIEARSVVSGDMEVIVDFDLYPNPVQDQVHFQFYPYTLSGSLLFYNRLGQELMTQTVSPGQRLVKTTLDRNLFATGIYYVSYKTGEKTVTRKFVVQY